MFRSTGLRIIPLALLAAVVAAGCDSGGREGSGNNIPGVNFNAAPLATENFWYQTESLTTARYSHTATTLEDGRVLVIGGTDERHFNSLDTAEIFDQSVRSASAVPPESITGDWFDTDFQGDTIAMRNGGRVFHSAVLLPSGNVLLCGGAPDIIIGAGVETSEIFDSQSRVFDPEDLDIPEDIEEVRFRHTVTALPNGKFLFAGGQITIDETVIDDNFPPGHPFFMQELQVFPSTETVEVFDPATLSFGPVTDVTGEPSQMVSGRGRADHVAVTVAGADDRLGTTDDLVVFSSGVKTLSGQFAPNTKFFQQFSEDSVSEVEYFDPQTRVFAQSPSVTCLNRANGARALNLGQYVAETPDGVEGVSNVIVITGGDDDTDNTSPALVFISVTRAEVFSLTFSGFGPAGGVLFADASFTGAFNHIEHFRVNPLCGAWGRSHADALIMPTQRTYLDVVQQSNWVAAAGGVYLFPAPGGGQGQNLQGSNCSGSEIRGITFFDPFWTEINRGPLTQPPEIEPADLTEDRTPQNPTGVTGSWILAHVPAGDVADGFWEGWAEGIFPVARPKAARVFHTLSRLGGEDGALNTLDDRILLVGGGELFFPVDGGEAVSISAEIYLPPNANLGTTP